MSTIIAQCRQDGVIFFHKRLHHGALMIIKGKRKRVKRIVSAKARRAYDGKTLLVPGIPEATDSNFRLIALIDFIELCENNKRDRK